MTDQLPMPIPAPLSRAQKAQLLNLVRRAARAEILPRFRKLDRLDVDTKSGAMDLVTAADTAAEAMITRGLQMAFPAALIVGEEAASRNSELRDAISDAEMGFLIDPVDGTWNFANGISTFGTMVAVTRFGKPVFGLIYDPLGDDVVMADEDSRATFTPSSGAPRALATAGPKPLGEMVGVITLRLLPKADQPAIAALLPEIGKLCTLGCSAHEYRLLAQGAVDFVLIAQHTPWDHAPGAILCEQAGGHVAMLDGSAYSTKVTEGYLLCAANQTTWDRVAARLNDILDPDAVGDQPLG